MLHLRDLHCFILVYELHSFSRTADSLDTVQSLISARIHRLEQFIGAPLFVRVHRGVLPTRKGEQLYQHAKRVVSDVAELESAVKLRDAIALPSARPPGPAASARKPRSVMTRNDLFDF